MIPMYEPLETSKCKKCGKIIAEPKELIGTGSLLEEITELCSLLQNQTSLQVL